MTSFGAIRAAAIAAVLALGALVPATPARAQASSCVATPAAQCEFSCDTGDTVYVEVGGGLAVQGGASCGEGGTSCSGTARRTGPDRCHQPTLAKYAA